MSSPSDPLLRGLRRPERAATTVSIAGTTLTYAALRTQADGLARAAAAAGLSRVAVDATPSMATVIRVSVIP